MLVCTTIQRIFENFHDFQGSRMSRANFLVGRFSARFVDCSGVLLGPNIMNMEDLRAESQFAAPLTIFQRIPSIFSEVK